MLDATGIGFPYMPVLPPSVYTEPLIDFVELTPEALCRERRQGDDLVLELDPEKLARAKKTCAGLPIVVHGVQLSIGSAHGWNCAYLDMLDQLQACWPFEWHSEHLAFQTMRGPESASVEIGVPLPMPLTHEAVRLVAARCREVQRRYGLPFLLENPAHYLAELPRDDAIADEIEFMNCITEQGSAGQLLDLHNLYCNSINFEFDAIGALDRLALDRVIEIHVAGGSWQGGYWTDAHDGCVPDPVWDLLAYTLPRAPNVAGVVFEILDRYALELGVPAMVAELARARSIVEDCRKRRAV